MIRRAQADALLKLAEALEECERLDMTFGFYPTKVGDVVGMEGGAMHSSMHLRMFINKQIPVGEVDKNCYWCGGTGIEAPEQGVTFGGRRCIACKSADVLELTVKR